MSIREQLTSIIDGNESLQFALSQAYWYASNAVDLKHVTVKAIGELLSNQNKLADILLLIHKQLEDLERDKHSHPEHYGN